MREHGLGTLVMPWQTNAHEFGGEGIKVLSDEDTKVKRNSRNKKPKPSKETGKPWKLKKSLEEEFEREFSGSIRN